jgi:hypothetical protein
LVSEHEAWLSGFSLVTGGPFYRLLRRAGLVQAGEVSIVRPTAAVLALAFVPLLLLATVERATTGRAEPLLTDFSVFARFVAAIPLFFAAESMLHVRCTRTIERFVQAGFAGDDGILAVERSLRRCERLRDRPVFELGLAMVAVLGGPASLWNLAGFEGFLQSAVHTVGFSLAQAWSSLVALPLFQFVLARGLWRWLIWSRVVFDLSRLRLRLVPTHPDHAGGIELLADPTYAFAVFAGGASSVVAGTWANKIVFGGEQAEAFVLPATLLALMAMLLAFGPLLAFVRTMVDERFRGVREYAALANIHARFFHDRWIGRPIDASVLGCQDISTLADLQQAYESMAKMRIVPFGPRAIVGVVASVLIPILPLVALEIPLSELLTRMGKTLFLGLPP